MFENNIKRVIFNSIFFFVSFRSMQDQTCTKDRSESKVEGEEK